MPRPGEQAVPRSHIDVNAAAEVTGVPVEDAVASLLDVVRGLLQVDTAVVLLTDPTGTQLEAFAARGLEEEVRQGYRMPVGSGFAGSIASRQAPGVLDRVDADTVVNPLLVAKGLRSMCGVPLLAGGRLLGVVHVGSLRARRFSANDVAVLESAAERIARVIHADQTTTDRASAWALQRSLLPTRLPDVDGIEFASRFVPARSAGVGGDWFDVFLLPDDRLGIVMGDVVGSGLRAAVIMGRLRSALRAYALVVERSSGGARSTQSEDHALRAR